MNEGTNECSTHRMRMKEKKKNDNNNKIHFGLG